MKKEFLKMAGVENEKDFYKLFPTEEAFFGMYPEAKKLVQKRYGGLIKANYGFGVTSMSTMPSRQTNNVETDYATRPSAAVPTPTAQQLAAVNPNIARNPMFRTFSGNLKFNWGDPKNRNIFSYGLTKEKENPYYSHAGTLGLNNLFGPGRGKLNLTGTYTPKTGEYNAGFNFGLPSKRMIGEGDEAQPKSNFTAGFGIMQNQKGNIERKAEAKYNTRLGTKASDPTLSIGVNAGFRYGGGLIKAVGGFNVTDLSTKPSMDCSSGTCQMNTDDYSWIKQNQKQKQPKPTTPWQNITQRKYVEEEYDKYKNEWENQYKNKYPGLTLDEFVAANRLSNYNRMNQPQYNDYFDNEGNQIEGMDQRVHQSQPYIKWARSTFNSPTPSVNTIMNYFQDNKLKKDDIKNFVNERYTFPKEHMITPSYFKMGGMSKKKVNGKLQQFYPGGFLTTPQTTKYPPLESDVNLLNESKQELLNWYTARANHPDPRISGEAKQVLENFNKLPGDLSKNINYKGVHYLIPQGLLGQYMPYDQTIEIANPYLPIEEQLKKPGFGYINRNPELKDHYVKFHQLSRTKEPIRHEFKHAFLHKTAEPIVDKYSDQIYSQFAGPDVYRENLYNRLDRPDLSREAAGKWGEANFDRDARYAYDWMTGTGFPNFKVNKKGNVKNMKNSELYRALMELRTEYGIDPSKNTTAEDFKNIYEKTKKSYEDAKKAKDPEKRLRYEHFLDLFNIHGNDFEKLNNLNNLLVGDVSSSLPIADEGFTVTETTTEAKIIEMPEVVIKPKDLSWWDKMKIYGKIFANATNYFLHPKHTWDRMKGIAEYEQKHPLPLALQILDPTGISNYGNVKTAYEKFRDEKGKKGFGNDYLNALLFDLEVASSVPILGKATKIASGAIKGSRAAKGISKGSKVVKPNIAREVILKPITNIDRLTGANRLLPLPTSAPKILSSAVDLTNSFNRGRRWMTGLLGGIDYGLDALSTFGSQNQAGTIPGVGPVQPGYTTNQGKVEKVQDDSLYVDPKRGDQVLTVQLPDGRIVKMSTGSKAYEDLINRVDENSSMFDDKKNMYIIKQYKK